MHASMTKSELLTLLDTIHRCSEAQHSDDLDGVFRQLSELIPVEAALIVLFSPPVGQGSAKPLGIVGHNYQIDKLTNYAGQELGENPVVSRAMTEARPFELRSVHTMDSVWRELLCPGNGLACGVAGRRDEPRSVISLSLGHRPLQERHYHVLHHIAPHLHEACRRVTLDEGKDEILPVLTGREREVLRWLRDGKNTWDIGQILNISERTVKFHVGNVCDKLSASNRAHAVAKAMDLGLV